MSRRTLESLLQALSRERLLESTGGPHGGYRLGRLARLIKLSDVIAVGLNSLEDTGHSLECRLQKAVIEPLWDEFDAVLLERTEAISIEDLVRRAAG
jgi:Rrf2 family transcriptional regulator, iron-sulfur cluster assembly transcription factor